MPRFGFGGRRAKEPGVAVGDPRFDGWETVGNFAEQAAALAWRDQLRELGVNAACVSDHPLDRYGNGDIYLVVPRAECSRATEILDNLD